jgi:hypothetical protein
VYLSRRSQGERVIDLRTDVLALTLDPAYGADILSMRTLPHGHELLWSSPWRERAEAIIGGSSGWAHEPVSANLERYRGGWQTLCPNAGAPRTLHGAPVGFHGEVARSAWTLTDLSSASARLRLDLMSVPVRIDRAVKLSGSTVEVVDDLTNLSDQELELDYCQHPAFGGDLLDGVCDITTGAQRFVFDPETSGVVPAGQASAWPLVPTRTGDTLDLTRLPGPGERQMVFGWLEDFDEHWYAIDNPARGLSVRVEWDGSVLPYAWFWQELNHSNDYPWFRRARVQAIEPASTQTSGPDRRSVLQLTAGASVRVPISVTVSASPATRREGSAYASPVQQGA